MNNSELKETTTNADRNCQEMRLFLREYPDRWILTCTVCLARLHGERIELAENAYLSGWRVIDDYTKCPECVK